MAVLNLDPEKLKAFIRDRIEIDANGCWLWTERKNKGGYARACLYADRKNHTVTISRLSYELYRGPIPPGLLACHICDVRHCVNPDHIFIGTYKDNIMDCMAKNRLAIGERRGTAVLKNADIPVIRQRLRNKETQRAIAQDYGVDESTIRCIHRGVSWKHIP